MNIKNLLEKFVRGWFPEEPKMPQNKLNLAETKGAKYSFLAWKYLPLLIVSAIFLVIVQVVLFFVGYVELLPLFGGILVLLLAFPLVYAIKSIQARYPQSKSVKLSNKLAFIVGPALLSVGVALFSLALISLITGVSTVNYLGPLGTILVMYVVAPVVGASIGYWIGKRRNFMPFV